MIDYFDFYDLEKSLIPNPATLRAKYYAIARKFHPDHNAEERAERMSAINNEAYNTLKDLQPRLKHLLELAGVWEEGKNTVPQDFLLEVMDIQEMIMEAKVDVNMMNAKRGELIDRIKDIESTLDKQLKTIESLDLKDKHQMQLLLNNYLKRRYLKRMQDNLI